MGHENIYEEQPFEHSSFKTRFNQMDTRINEAFVKQTDLIRTTMDRVAKLEERIQKLEEATSQGKPPTMLRSNGTGSKRSMREE